MIVEIILTFALVVALIVLARERMLRQIAEKATESLALELIDTTSTFWPGRKLGPPISEQPIRSYVARRNPDGPIFAIRYQSRDGDISERIVMPIVIESESLFQAYCYLRDDLRHFRSDRVIEFFDPETGEAFESFEQACDRGAEIADRWKQERKRRRKNGETLGVYRSTRK